MFIFIYQWFFRENGCFLFQRPSNVALSEPWASRDESFSQNCRKCIVLMDAKVGLWPKVNYIAAVMKRLTEDKDQRDLFGIMKFSTALGLGVMCAFLYSLKDV